MAGFWRRGERPRDAAFGQPGDFANGIRGFLGQQLREEVQPLAWLTDVLERMVSGRTKAHELARLLPWAWKVEQLAAVAGA
jgi:hypothetical protein